MNLKSIPRRYGWTARPPAGVICVLAVLAVMAALSAAASERLKLSTLTPPAGTLSVSLAYEILTAVRLGLDGLVSLQHDDGSWSDRRNPALTALAAETLIRDGSARYSAALGRALKFIESCIQPDGGIYYSADPGTPEALRAFTTAVCMATLFASGHPAYGDAIANARAYLVRAQHRGDGEYRGGFGYQPGETEPYIYLIAALYTARAARLTAPPPGCEDTACTPGDIDWSEAIRFLSRFQHAPDAPAAVAGGFGYAPLRASESHSVALRAYGSYTYAGLLAFTYAGLASDDARVLAAFDWAARHWRLDENPGMGRQGLYFFYAVMAQALSAVDVDLIPRADGTFVNWRHDLGRRLVSLQQIDSRTGFGFWRNEDTRFWENDPALTTAYALSALQRLLPEQIVENEPETSGGDGAE